MMIARRYSSGGKENPLDGMYVYLIKYISSKLYLFRSDDYGETFSNIADLSLYMDYSYHPCICTSSDGSIVLICGSIYVAGEYYFNVCISYNYGEGFEYLLSDTGKGNDHLLMSSDGKYIFVHHATELYLSSDYGNTFTQVSNSGAIFTTMSDDGSVIIYTDSTQMKVSTDHGQSFTTKTKVGYPLAYCDSISGNGNYILTQSSTTQYKFSTDYLSTIQATTVQTSYNNLLSSCCNYSGKIHYSYGSVMYQNGGRIYISKDYANSFAFRNTTEDGGYNLPYLTAINAMRCSASGRYVFIAGYFYLSSSYYYYLIHSVDYGETFIIRSLDSVLSLVTNRIL